MNNKLELCRVRHYVLMGLALLSLAPVVSAESTGTPKYDPGLPALMPYPRQTRAQYSEPVRLDAHSRICFAQTMTARIRAASDRFRQRLQRQQKISLPPATPCSDLPPNAGSLIELSFESTPQPANENLLAAININREFYRLHIGAGKVQLSAHSDLGLLHGLNTLSQYIGIDKGDATAGYQLLPAVKIADYPRFRWRGLMLDSVRHFFSVDTIKRQLDGIAAAKLNVFHWHLTDDQGWRLQSKAYPRLHQTAAGGNFYTWDQVRDIVAYAAERGIVVVPEIDMPGHASAIAVAYPELMSAPGPYQPEDRWGVHKPLLNPANPAVYTFAQEIFREVAALFPFEFVHVGGDEVDPEHWEQNPEIQRYRQEHGLVDSHALHNHFNRRLADILAGFDRKMIGWDEILHPGLSDSATVQSWRGPDALGDIVRAGHYGLLSTGFYLDQPQYTGYHYRNDLIPSPLEFPAIQDGEQWQRWQFSAPRKRGSPVSGILTLVESNSGSLRGVVTFDGKQPSVLRSIERSGPYTRFKMDTWMGPLRARLHLQDNTLTGEFVVGNAPYQTTGELVGRSERKSEPGYFVSGNVPLGEDQVKRILGGEAALWAEMVTEQSIDLRLWPRTFAVAERLWSGEELVEEDFLYRRMTAIDAWAESALGLRHKIQQAEALQRLFPENLGAEALAFSAVLEPAHYYHRHHEKSANETYSRRDALNRLADSLPVESMALRDFRQLLDNLPANPADQYTRKRLHNGLTHLNRAGTAAERLLRQRDQLPQDAQQLAERVQQQMQLASRILPRFREGNVFSAQEETEIRVQLDSLKGMHHEVVLPAVYVLERLLDHLQYSANDQQKGQNPQHG